MSGDIQARRRKGKGKKKDEEDDMVESKAKIMTGNGKQNGDGGGSGVVAKLFFLILLVSLSLVVGLILVELRGKQAAVKESRSVLPDAEEFVTQAPIEAQEPIVPITEAPPPVLQEDLAEETEPIEATPPLEEYIKVVEKVVETPEEEGANEDDSFFKAEEAAVVEEVVEVVEEVPVEEVVEIVEEVVEVPAAEEIKQVDEEPEPEPEVEEAPAEVEKEPEVEAVEQSVEEVLQEIVEEVVVPEVEEEEEVVEEEVKAEQEAVEVQMEEEKEAAPVEEPKVEEETPEEDTVKEVPQEVVEEPVVTEDVEELNAPIEEEEKAVEEDDDDDDEDEDNDDDDNDEEEEGHESDDDDDDESEQTEEGKAPKAEEEGPDAIADDGNMEALTKAYIRVEALAEDIRSVDPENEMVLQLVPHIAGVLRAIESGHTDGLDDTLSHIEIILLDVQRRFLEEGPAESSKTPETEPASEPALGTEPELVVADSEPLSTSEETVEAESAEPQMVEAPVAQPPPPVEEVETQPQGIIEPEVAEKDSKAEAIVVSEPEAAVVSEPEPGVASESEGAAVSEPEKVVASESEGAVVSVPEPVVVSESEGAVASEPDVAVVSEPDAAIVSEPEALVDSEPAVVVDSEQEAVVVSEPVVAETESVVDVLSDIEVESSNSLIQGDVKDAGSLAEEAVEKEQPQDAPSVAEEPQEVPEEVLANIESQIIPEGEDPTKETKVETPVTPPREGEGANPIPSPPSEGGEKDPVPVDEVIPDPIHIEPLQKLDTKEAPKEASPPYEKADVTSKVDNEIREELDAAEKQLPQNPGAALNSFGALLHLHPKSARALYGRAQSQDRLAEVERSNSWLEKAIVTYRSVIDLADEDPTVVPLPLLRMAAEKCIERMRFRGFLGKAVRVQQRLLQRFPDDIGLRNQMGVTFLMMNQASAAKDVYKAVLEINQDDGFAQVHYGFILKTTYNNNTGGIEYMRKGIDSGVEGTQDGRFYFHLGDALQREGKMEDAYKIYDVAVEKGLFLSRYQRSLYNVDRLRSQALWTQEETTYQEFFKKLEDNWLAIQREALEALALPPQDGFRPEAENLQDTGDWKQYELFSRGKKITANCVKAPKTCALVEEFQAAAGCKRGQVKFSVMYPGTHVHAHTGPTNCRLRSHLGLIVPEGLRLRVGDNTVKWIEGKVFVFDDSWEHEVWHEGDAPRLILIVDVWHPELTEEEKKTLTAI